MCSAFDHLQRHKTLEIQTRWKSTLLQCFHFAYSKHQTFATFWLVLSCNIVFRRHDIAYLFWKGRYTQSINQSINPRRSTNGGIRSGWSRLCGAASNHLVIRYKNLTRLARNYMWPGGFFSHRLRQRRKYPRWSTANEFGQICMQLSVVDCTCLHSVVTSK